jgi:Terminase large subunit, T4likevirus-type, N-terminal
MRITLKPPQRKVFLSPERFRVLVAGRRFGKTYLALTELCRGAAGPGRLAWYVCPSYRMAKRIAWKPLKEMTRPFWAGRPNETDLRIELRGGGTICLRGADNYDSLRGDGLDFLVLDEYASMAPEAWTEVLRPALADKQGRALFTGTPQGHNHFHELVQRARMLDDWKAFQFTTAQGGNVTPEELESAAKELDEKVFRQEFEASFENLGVGRAYYAFDREHNVRNLGFSSSYELCWEIDFNMNPLCSVRQSPDRARQVPSATDPCE